MDSILFEEMKYLILSFLRSGVRAKRGIEIHHSTSNAFRIWQKLGSLHLCAGYSVKVKKIYIYNQQEVKLSNSIEERVRNTTDRVEHITTKMEDLNQKANCQIQSMQVTWQIVNRFTQHFYLIWCFYFIFCILYI